MANFPKLRFEYTLNFLKQILDYFIDNLVNDNMMNNKFDEGESGFESVIGLNETTNEATWESDSIELTEPERDEEIQKLNKLSDELKEESLKIQSRLRNELFSKNPELESFKLKLDDMQRNEKDAFNRLGNENEEKQLKDEMNSSKLLIVGSDKLEAMFNSLINISDLEHYQRVAHMEELKRENAQLKLQVMNTETKLRMLQVDCAMLKEKNQTLEQENEKLKGPRRLSRFSSMLRTRMPSPSFSWLGKTRDSSKKRNL